MWFNNKNKEKIAQVTEAFNIPIDTNPIIDLNKIVDEHNPFFAKKPLIKVKLQGKNDLEKALYLFREIKFYDDLKFNLYRALTGGVPINILIGGPKGTAKTFFTEIIEKSFNDVLYINSKTTAAGLAAAIKENPNIKIIIFDEADKILDKGDNDEIRSFLSTGKLSRKLKSGNIEIEIKNLITIITANNIEKYDVPTLSRYMEVHLEPYTDEQFKEICLFKMPEYNANMIEEIAQLLIDSNMKDIRNIVKIKAMIRPDDPPAVIEMILKTFMKYTNTATKTTNWDKVK